MFMLNKDSAKTCSLIVKSGKISFFFFKENYWANQLVTRHEGRSCRSKEAISVTIYLSEDFFFACQNFYF